MFQKCFKNFINVSLITSMIIGMSATAYANEQKDVTSELQSAYDSIIEYSEMYNIDLYMDYQEFLDNYDGQSVQQYEQSYYEILLPQTVQTRSSSSGGSSTYYYNTGYSCPSKANYSKYNLLNVVKKGDIIYEANGGFGVTGHIAIVDGIYTKTDGSGEKYIRLIEAISNDYGGVTRSILDDTRVDEKSVTILRVSGATSTNITEAVKFCRGEVGSKYKLDVPAKDTSSNETDWYCSELVWAAYKKQGIDIEVGGLHGEPGITPHDILNSSKTYIVPYSKKK